MPRGPRLDAPGILHHVRSRGIERRKIFLGEGDRLDFLARLEAVCSNGGAFVYAWCLMDNHFHLALRSGRRSLSTVMRRLLTGYAGGFNARHRRSGHLFQNRYQSTVVEEERYFLALVRYIHLNPMRAGLVKSVAKLGRYRWTGHAVLLGHEKAPWQDVDEVLSRFGKRAGPARRELISFMGQKEAEQEADLLRGADLMGNTGGQSRRAEHRQGERFASDERVLGSGRFVQAVLKKAESVAPQMAGHRDAEQRREALEDLLESVCRRLGVAKAELTAGSKRHEVSRARKLLSHCALRHLGLTAAEVGRAMGVSSQAILKAADAGPDVLQELEIDVEKLIR